MAGTCWRTDGSYRHDTVVDHAAHLDVIQVAVADVRCQVASGSSVGARGPDQPLDCQGFREELRLQLQVGKSQGAVSGAQTQNMPVSHRPPHSPS